MQSTLELAELDSKIAQLFMVGMPGTDLDENTKRLIGDVGIGGIILFSRNVKDPVQVAELCDSIQQLATQTQDRPLFLAVDQEGGRVSRLREPFSLFPGNEAIGKSSTPEKEAGEFARVTAKEMALVGLNMDLAPVLDVPRGEPEEHLKGRTFGPDPELTSGLGNIMIRTLQGGGIMAVAKHFPGLGAAGLDPHKTELTIDVHENELRKIDFKPFEGAIESKVVGIMISHAYYPAVDSQRPATMSPVIIGEILREELGFKGLILTDDLEMGAITRQWGVPEAAALALEAGADVLLICENQELVPQAISEIRDRILRGNIPLQRLHEAVERIVNIKNENISEWHPRLLTNVYEYFAGQGEEKEQ